MTAHLESKDTGIISQEICSCSHCQEKADWDQSVAGGVSEGAFPGGAVVIWLPAGLLLVIV